MTKTIENNFETKLGTLWVYFIIESYFRCTLQSPYGQRLEINIFESKKRFLAK